MLEILFLALLLPLACHARTKEEWKSRTIYQVLTDRFARSDGNSNSCYDLRSYCGGNYQGLIKKLDYIQELGFDAIWITPVIENFPGGYHGYWAKNKYNTNDNFGSTEDLVALKDALHARDMWLMIDVVANHMGTPPGYDYSQLTPFNSNDHFHDCNNDCHTGSCNIENFGYQSEVEVCRLAGLPDLKQENPWVAKTLQDWIGNVIVGKYGADGLRIDTIPEVPGWFWKQFAASAGVYTVGEVFNGDPKYVGPYQQYLDGTLNYPMYYKIRDVFQSGRDMRELDQGRAANQNSFQNLDYLGTFVDNHDNARFLHQNNDWNVYRAALTYVLMGEGIPIVYYGSEQGYGGGNDPNNRESLWPNYNKDHAIYQHIQKVIAARKQFQIWNTSYTQRYADSKFYAFNRGKVLICLTNAGGSGGQQSRYVYNLPYAVGSKLSNIFYPDSDILTIGNQGSATIYLNNGESKVYIPRTIDTLRRFNRTMQS